MTSPFVIYFLDSKTRDDYIGFHLTAPGCWGWEEEITVHSCLKLFYKKHTSFVVVLY